MKRRRENRPDPRRAIQEVGRLVDDLTRTVRAKASGELPAGSPVRMDVPAIMVPLSLDSAIARIRRLREEILARSGALCDLLSEAFITGNRGQLAAAIETGGEEPRGEVAEALGQIVGDLELTVPQLEANLEDFRRCASLHRTMASSLGPAERQSFKDLGKRMRDQIGE